MAKTLAFEMGIVGSSPISILTFKQFLVYLVSLNLLVDTSLTHMTTVSEAISCM